MLQQNETPIAMKAVNNVKNLIAGLTILISVQSLNAQESTGNIWTMIPSSANLQITTTRGVVTTNSEAVNTLISNFNITSIEKAAPASRSEKLQSLYQIDCQCDEQDLLVEVAKLKNTFVSPEIGPKYETLGMPNDFNLAVSNDYALNLINAQGAWTLTEGDSSIVIGITDAGYYMNNMELYPKVVSSNLNFSMTNAAHGTAVATTAAGSTNNAFGKSSIGFNSSLDLRPMNYNGLLEATYAGAKVINASWAGGCYYSFYGQDIVNEVYNNGSIIVASAGNGSTCNNASTKVYPASYEHVISVTSVGPSNNHERTIGNPATTHQHNDAVDICAPGYDVYVTTTNGSFITANGTSFAAPYVSGTVALMLAVNKCLTFEDVDYILKASADTVVNAVNPQYAGGLGAGRLDAAKAVAMAKDFSKFDVTVSQSVNCENFTYGMFTGEFYGESPYTIEWSNGVTGPMNTVNTAGVYELRVEDNRGCRHYSEIEVIEYVEMNIETMSYDITCNGLSDGMVKIEEITGGVEGFTYEWSNGSTVSKIQNLLPGTYSVTVTDAKGCAKTSEVTIIEPAALTVEVEITNPLTGTATGAVDVTAEGGVGAYSYVWHNGMTEEDLTNIEAGVYEVTVTDGNGCSATQWAVLQGSMAGIAEAIENGDVKVYPNPATDVVNVDWSVEGVQTVRLMNLNGQTVEEINATGVSATTINVSELPVGIYMVAMEMQDGTSATTKLIKR